MQKVPRIFHLLNLYLWISDNEHKCSISAFIAHVIYITNFPILSKASSHTSLNMAQNTFYGSNIQSATERFTTGISPVTFDGGTERKVKVWEKFPFSLFISNTNSLKLPERGPTSSAALGKLFCASVSQAFPLTQCLFKFFYIWF